ncbi:MAG: hypothetical protein ABFD82_18370 [Syntrophaceae bacterium]
MNNDMFLSKLVNMNYDEFFVSSSISKFWYVKGYMERNMPETLDTYLRLTCKGLLPKGKERDIAYWDIETLNYVLDLNNLVTYLSEHREWGIKEVCSEFNRWHNPCPQFCNKCDDGSGTIKHPALVYLEAQCEK